MSLLTDQMAEAACELPDATARSGWSVIADDDALVAIDTLTAALAQIDPDVSEALAAVTATTTKARLCLGLPADTGQEPDRAATPLGVPGPRTGRRPPRRGLGPVRRASWTGVRGELVKARSAHSPPGLPPQVTGPR
ncbi:hypothetical protein [Streptomyces hydrogenans]